MLDLHIHSNYSLDGKENINEILKRCEEANIELVSITDHNTAFAYKDINFPFKGKIITGIEADALFNDKTFDVLCFDFELEPVAMWANKQYQTIEKRQTKIFEALKKACKRNMLEFDDSIDFNPSEEFAHAAMFRMLEKNNNSLAFLKDNNIMTFGDFYRATSTDKNFPLYIDMSIVWPSIEQVNKIIHQNGGKTFIAHPFKYKKISGEEVLELTYKYIDGIEISNNNSKEEVDYLYDFAKKHNLLICAGSDYHSSKEDTLGGTHLNEKMTQEIEEWIKK